MCECVCVCVCECVCACMNITKYDYCTYMYMYRNRNYVYMYVYSYCANVHIERQSIVPPMRNYTCVTLSMTYKYIVRTIILFGPCGV